MPETVPPETRRHLAAYGADIITTPSGRGMRGALDRAVEAVESGTRRVLVDQFGNPANPETHRRTTAMEIIRDLGRTPDAFVACVGTGGTITGVGHTLKERNPGVRVVAVEPADSPILSGGNPGPNRIPGIGAGFIPKVLDSGIIDDVAVVGYEEAVGAVKWMAEEKGIFAGLSSGAAVTVAFGQAERLDPDQVVVTVLCDAGERYISQNTWY
jgi:cysteine synthase A